VKRTLMGFLALAGLVGVTAAVALAAKPAAKNFVASLKGAGENPATTSKGAGEAVFNLRSGVLKFRLSASNIKNVTAAHIHCGAKGVNGPVVATLWSGTAMNPHGLFAKGTVTVAAVTASTECPGGVANLAELLAKMRTGGAYVNIHTTGNPGGEIRGQVKPGGPRPS
jgi:hypothetical protein